MFRAALAALACTILQAWADNNGLALLPPMAWRSWNAFYDQINVSIIQKQIDALAEKRGADGRPHHAGVSLLSLGYASIGVDEGWEGCGMGVNGTVHYANGTPTVDLQRFPDMPGLVDYGHKKKVKMGFYLNGCGCRESVEHRINYQGDVRATVGWGFDEVKIDSCGAQKNMTLYNALFNATGTPILIENCHQGQDIPDGGDPDQMGPGWCPYNTFRTSYDIVNVWDRVMSNLLTVVPFLRSQKKVKAFIKGPLSRPGCWAYPDMLEVGRMPEHNAAESRSHFSAWAMVSSPLVLGFDLSNQEKMSAAWPIISNKEVIEISQTWVAKAKHPTGFLLKQWRAPNVPTLMVRGACSKGGCLNKDPRCTEWAAEDQCFINPGYMRGNCPQSCGTCAHGNFSGWKFSDVDGTLRQGDLCLDTEGQLPAGHTGGNVMHMLPCVPNKASQKWIFKNKDGGRIEAAAGGQCLNAFNTYVWDAIIVTMANCSNSSSAPSPTGSSESWKLDKNGTLQHNYFGCIEVSLDSGPTSTIWSKPLSSGRMALLTINGADKNQDVTLNFGDLGFGSKDWNARDVWAAKELGLLKSIRVKLAPHDCSLLVLSPEASDDKEETAKEMQII